MLVALDKKLKFKKIIVKEGGAPNEIGRIFGISIVDSLLFVQGSPELLIYNLHSQKIIAKHRFAFDMVSQIQKVNDVFVCAAIRRDSDEEEYFCLHQFKFDKKLGLVHLTKQTQLEPDMEVDNFLLTGHLLNLPAKNSLFFVFDWLGEYYEIDKTTYKVKQHQKLPYFGDVKKFIAQSSELPPYYQAYGAHVLHDSLLVILREVDFETTSVSNPNEKQVEKTVRKRVQIYNSKLQKIGSQLLPIRATNIKIIDNKYLFASHLNDEKCYIYEINQELLSSIAARLHPSAR
ncbi:MAG: hypothetical protein HC913_21055 [Microscillaceae bacterium]|nr:hypothetical protein [Microscillaceae bacterium]